MKTRWFMLMIGVVALVPLVVVGCGGDDGGTTGGGTVDTTPPSVTQVTAVDGGHVDVTFDENVDKGTAERPENYIIVEATPTPVAGADDDKGLPFEEAAPGDTVWVGAAVLQADGKTVGLTTLSSMNDAPYDMYVSGVRDVRGNEMTSTQSMGFTGTSNADVTPPQIVSRDPAPGATGVGIGQSVIVTFSEPMDWNSVSAAFQWTWASGMVGFTVNWQNATTVAFSPVQQLDLNTLYTVSLTNTATDLAGNPLTLTTWTFRTMAMPDTKRPTLVSTYPANGAVNVPTDVVLQLRFSEAIDPTSINSGGGPSVIVVPDVGDGIVSWTNGGRTLNFEPFSPLLDNQQYTLTVPEGAVADYAGNPLEGSTVATFTTGSSLPTGRIMGELAGDPSSPDASNPAGAVVIAAANAFFRNDEDPYILGAAVAGTGGGYSIQNLPNGVYWPAAFLESNGDGVIDPDLGDAFGAYGADVASGDFTIDSVEVVGGGIVQNVNFTLFDPIAIGGSVVYIGTTYDVGQTPFFYVGIFDTTGFDPTSQPDYGTNVQSINVDPTFSVGELGDGLVDGTYYVGAFLDANFNSQYDPASDPAGVYDDAFGVPIPVTVANGRDAVGIVVEMDDPVAGAFTGSVTWKTRPRSGTLSGNAAERRFHSWIKEMLARQNSTP